MKRCSMCGVWFLERDFRGKVCQYCEALRQAEGVVGDEA